MWSGTRRVDRTCSREQAALFRDGRRHGRPGGAVPSCPGWTFTDLTVHVGRFLHTVTRYLTSGSDRRAAPAAGAQRPSTRSSTSTNSSPPPPQVLTDTSGNRPVWTFSPAAPDLAWVWHRRVAHELNLRRWDAQAALRTLTPTDREQAADAVDELLGTLLAARAARRLATADRGHRRGVLHGRPAGVARAAHPGRGARGAAGGARNEQADARLSNRTANVLYQLWSRMQLTGSGDQAVLRALRMS